VIHCFIVPSANKFESAGSFSMILLIVMQHSNLKTVNRIKYSVQDCTHAGNGGRFLRVANIIEL